MRCIILAFALLLLASLPMGGSDVLAKTNGNIFLAQDDDRYDNRDDDDEDADRNDDADNYYDRDQDDDAYDDDEDDDSAHGPDDEDTDDDMEPSVRA